MHRTLECNLSRVFLRPLDESPLQLVVFLLLPSFSHQNTHSQKLPSLQLNQSFYPPSFVSLNLSHYYLYVQPETKIENCSSSAPLQIDVVDEILSRLPAKTIAKFRCVCKRWLYLTRDPHFLKLQHQRSSSYILFNKCVRYGKIKLYDFNNGDERKPAKSSYRLDIGRTYYKLSNFVDGLACAYANSEFARPGICLLNPMTRENQKLPMTTSRAKCCKHESVGLGIDMAEGKYKVVWLFSSSMSHRAHCEIYTVGTAQWRCLGEAPFGFSYSFDSVLLHGSLHWIGYVLNDNHREGKFGLYRFSIKEETFGSAISLPAHSFTRSPLYSLKVSGGKLWPILNNHTEHYFEIWSMEDYVHGTWVKEYKFDNSCLSSFRDNYHVVEFVDGELFLKCIEQVIWRVICYNPRSGVLRKLISGKQQGNVAIYRESLISPKKLSEVTQSL